MDGGFNVVSLLQNFSEFELERRGLTFHLMKAYVSFTMQSNEVRVDHNIPCMYEETYEEIDWHELHSLTLDHLHFLDPNKPDYPEANIYMYNIGCHEQCICILGHKELIRKCFIETKILLGCKPNIAGLSFLSKGLNTI